MKTSSQKKLISWQKLEALALFGAATVSFFVANGQVWMYILGIFAFDISMVGYLRNSKLGALVYNLGHSLLLPTLLLAWAFVNESDPLAQLSLLWLAHVGMDRSLGYGLKADSGFVDTHLGKISASSKK